MKKKAIFTYLIIRTCAETENSSAHCYVAGLWADPVDHSRRDAGPCFSGTSLDSSPPERRNKFASFAAALKTRTPQLLHVLIPASRTDST
ncbi:uncharacterized protein NPIL_657251 [Nephila pilipes]|uniref:Uncharacterized protein n=1 Tax=Nephila pilipes TaxID=299642 RepID=A0A8X6UVW9_NEPPI|nr:uncharacterized protein NPIL_657251 [Nephila pilipes]